jgi:tetratricopeptide (TPR) repeat protein
MVAGFGALCLAGHPTHASAQAGFLDAVRDLVAIHGDASENVSGDLTRRRTRALDRMTAALAEWDRSLETLERRVRAGLRDATDPGAFQLRVELGLAYRQRGRLDDALREFDAAADIRPDASDVHLLRALTLDAAGKDADAAGAFAAAWRRDTSNPVKAYLALKPGNATRGLVTRGSGLDAAERERARTVLQEAVTRIEAPHDRQRGAAFLVLDPVPDTLSARPIVGDAAMAGVFGRLAQGRFDEAVAAFNARSTESGTDSRSPLTEFERGRADEAGGQYASARRAYEAALGATLAGRHVLYIGIGRLAQVDGDLDGAVEAFEQAVRLHPNSPIARRELAAAYVSAGRSDDAFAELAAALLVDPANVGVLTAVGQHYVDTDRPEEAITVLRLAVERNPNQAEAHYALAIALSRVGRADEAARQFERFERISGAALDDRRRAVTGHAGPSEAAR